LQPATNETHSENTAGELIYCSPPHNYRRYFTLGSASHLHSTRPPRKVACLDSFGCQTEIFEIFNNFLSRKYPTNVTFLTHSLPIVHKKIAYGAPQHKTVQENPASLGIIGQKTPVYGVRGWGLSVRVCGGEWCAVGGRKVRERSQMVSGGGTSVRELCANGGRGEVSKLSPFANLFYGRSL